MGLSRTRFTNQDPTIPIFWMHLFSLDKQEAKIPSMGFWMVERMAQLIEKSFRNRMSLDSIAGRPLPRRCVISSEKTINPREVDRKIPVNGLSFNSMVPMVKPRSDHQSLHPSGKVPGHVRVD